MQQILQTLLEQMRITDSAVRQRKELLSFTNEDAEALAKFSPVVVENIDSIVSEFYRIQTDIDEIALLIGDADTLARLQKAQRTYLLDLFSGSYDLEYVNNRLRIGLVHKRIGVDPRLYLSATFVLKNLLIKLIKEESSDEFEAQAILLALDKLFFFDITLVVETYVRSLVTEIETAKEKSDTYASDLEERTRQLEELSRIDPLTGLLNRRSLVAAIRREIALAQRHSEPISLVYLDINNFKEINDNNGHKRGDEVLASIGNILESTVRSSDSCFRIGGDEFCVLLPQCAKEDAEIIFCDRFQQNLNDKLYEITVSVGIHTIGPKHYLSAEEFIEKADLAMFAAKKHTRTKSEETLAN